MGSDAVRTPAPGEAHLDDPSLLALGQPPRAVVGPAGQISHRGWAAATVTVGPLFGRGRRALEALSCTRIGPSVLNDTASKPQPALGSEQGISVGHEDLSVIRVLVVTTPIPEVLTYIPLATPFTTCQRVTASPRGWRSRLLHD